MAANSGISWCDATWGVVAGCERCSPGCANCWAVRDTWRLAHNPNPKVSAPNVGLVERRGDRLDWTGEVRCLPERLEEPLHWHQPKRIFVASRGDLFHKKVPEEFIDRVFAAMALCPQHTFLILTKRPERMRAYCTQDGIGRVGYVEGRAKRLAREVGRPVPDGRYLLWPLPNVWIGVTVENQQTADERIPLLLQTPAAVRWVSAEPLLGSLDLGLCGTVPRDISPRYSTVSEHLHWVVVGCESGPKRRLCAPEWIRSLVRQCSESGVACYVKQLDPYGRVSHDPAEWPEDLRVRQFPEVTPVSVPFDPLRLLLQLIDALTQSLRRRPRPAVDVSRLVGPCRPLTLVHHLSSRTHEGGLN